jgi:hypothetical protein
MYVVSDVSKKPIAFILLTFENEGSEVLRIVRGHSPNYNQFGISLLT